MINSTLNFTYFNIYDINNSSKRTESENIMIDVKISELFCFQIELKNRNSFYFIIKVELKLIFYLFKVYWVLFEMSLYLDDIFFSVKI